MLRQKLLKHMERLWSHQTNCAQLRHPKIGFHLVGQSFGVHATPFFWACRVGCHGVPLLLQNWMCMDVVICGYNWCSPSSQSSVSDRCIPYLSYLILSYSDWSAPNSMGGVLGLLQGFFDDFDDLPSNHYWLANRHLTIPTDLQSNPAWTIWDSVVW